MYDLAHPSYLDHLTEWCEWVSWDWGHNADFPYTYAEPVEHSSLEYRVPDRRFEVPGFFEEVIVSTAGELRAALANVPDDVGISLCGANGKPLSLYPTVDIGVVAFIEVDAYPDYKGA